MRTLGASGFVFVETISSTMVNVNFPEFRACGKQSGVFVPKNDRNGAAQRN